MAQRKNVKEGKPEEIFVIKDKKKVYFNVQRCSSLEKFIGLMFSNREKDNLLFDFKKDTNISIHSFFVFYDFLAVWLNEKNELIEAKIIKPFSAINEKPSIKYRKLVEIPVNSRNKKIIRFLVGNK